MTLPKRKLLPLEAVEALDTLHGVVRAEQDANNQQMVAVTEEVRSVAATRSLGREPQAGDPAGMYRWVDPSGKAMDIAWNGTAETGRTAALATQNDLDTTKQVADTAQGALRNTALSDLRTKKRADGPQLCDGSRWLPQIMGSTPENGGTAINGVDCVWVREFNGPVYPRWWGAAADGVTNDDVACQAAWDYSARHGNPVDGENRHYCLRRTLLDSGTTLTRAFIWADATGGGENQCSPLTIDGRYHGPLPRTRALMEAARKRNITIEDVHVNGQRAKMTNCDGREDGGRSGLMAYGRASSITVRRSSFNFCATDGVMLFSDTGNSGASTIESERVCSGDPAFTNITLEDVDCLWNRRCGTSWDAIVGLRVVGRCRWNHNGLDLPGISADTLMSAGSRGARLNGVLYAQGGDFEGYGVGSRCADIYLGPDGEALGNARQGVLFLPDDAEHNHPTFQPWDNLEVHTRVDQGVHSDEQAAITLSGNRVVETDLIGRPMFTNVTMRPHLQGGYIQAKGAFGMFFPRSFTGAGMGGTTAPPVALIHSGGIIRNPDGAADHVLPEVALAVPGTQFQGRVPHLGFPALRLADGAALTLTNTSQSVVARLDGVNRLRLTYTAQVTGAGSANPVERRSILRWDFPGALFNLRLVTQRWAVSSDADLSISPTLPASHPYEYAVIWSRNGAHTVNVELDVALRMP